MSNIEQFFGGGIDTSIYTLENILTDTETGTKQINISSPYKKHLIVLVGGGYTNYISQSKTIYSGLSGAVVCMLTDKDLDGIPYVIGGLNEKSSINNISCDIQATTLQGICYTAASKRTSANSSYYWNAAKVPDNSIAKIATIDNLNINYSPPGGRGRCIQRNDDNKVTTYAEATPGSLTIFGLKEITL